MKKLDRKDQDILRLLEADARLSNVELADRVGLSPSACLRRVQGMEAMGIIRGYRAILDRSLVGCGFVIFVSVGLNDQSHASAAAFERAIAAAPEVRECHNVTGSIEYLLRVEVKDLAAYKHFHAQVLGELPNVHNITSHVCLTSPKDERA